MEKGYQGETEVLRAEVPKKKPARLFCLPMTKNTTRIYLLIDFLLKTIFVA